MQLIHLEISQNDCCLNQLTEILPNITVIVPYVESIDRNVENNYLYIYNIESIDQSYYILEFLKTKGLKLELLSKTKDQILLRYNMKQTYFWDMTRKKALKVLFPIIAKKGTEKWILIKDSKETFEFDNCNLKKVKYLEIDHAVLEAIYYIVPIHHLIKALESLTYLEKSLIKKAYYDGYFKYPREMSLKDLARYYRVSPNTIAKRMKNVERKLVRYIINFL